MLRTFLATLALAFTLAIGALPASAHPGYPGLTEKSPTAGKIAAHGAAGVLATARRYIGTNPTKMRALWCANFIGMIERKHGRAGTGSNLARSYASYGKGVARAAVRPGDIVVLARGRRGGHVGYFVKWAGKGRVQLVSGNAGGGRVRESIYPTSRVIAYRRPT